MIERKTAMDTIVLAAERELRATGSLSDETCRAFAAAKHPARRGFEASFAFLGCPTTSSSTEEGPAAPSHRTAAVRLMLLRLGAHTSTPQWSSHVLDNLVEAALRPPNATLSDIVQALFELLAEGPAGLSNIKANFIREIGIHVVGRLRRRYATEDFSWLATAISDPTTKPTASQAYLVAYTLPPSFTPQCLDAILQALHSTPFEEQVKRELGE
jgi:aminopeptidase N